MTKLWSSISSKKSRTFGWNLILISAVIFIYIVMFTIMNPAYALTPPPPGYLTNVVTMNGVSQLWVHSSWIEGGLFYGHSDIPLGVCLTEAITNLTTLVKGNIVAHTINNNLTHIFDVTNGEFLSSFDPENFYELLATLEEE